MPSDSADQAFVQDVQWALRHLYDLAELRKSALLQTLNLSHNDDPLAGLHAVIMDAIHALKPGAGVPAQAHSWRVYHILFHRYAEQFTQRQVAIDLVLSVRQLRRQEDLAVEVLANYLWSHYDLQKSSPATAATSAPVASGESAPSREQELDWLKRTMPSEATDTATAIRSVLQTVAPMTRAMGVSVQCESLENLPSAAVPLTTLRQALLNVLTAAVRSVPHERIHIAARVHDETIRVSISALSSNPVAEAYPEDYIERLDMARQLVELSGGSLVFERHPEGQALFTVVLVLPAVKSLEVMIIDDNLDTLHLFQDYLAGTRYHATVTPDPQNALNLIEHISFQAIVLDVMLPEIDGWELLGRLREHPATQSVPILVCSIMPQEDLALTIGAAAFLRKPVSRLALLSALDRLTVSLAPES